jgi:hypothetical protein
MLNLFISLLIMFVLILFYFVINENFNYYSENLIKINKNNIILPINDEKNKLYDEKTIYIKTYDNINTKANNRIMNLIDTNISNNPDDTNINNNPDDTNINNNPDDTNINNKPNDIEFKPIENPKCVCIYAYYEKDEKYKENFRYFLNNGILDNIDYYIVINGSCTVTIPERSNLIVINRENKGYDFGAWNYCINNFINKKYDYYIFLNTSVRGPYLNDNDTNWVKEFLKLFNTKDVKLVGTTISVFSNAGGYFDRTLLRNISNHNGPYTHVQSMFFILDDESFNYLKKLDFFKQDFYNFKDLIANKEIGMSQLILKNNWNINCILPKYQNYDYRIVKQNFNPTCEDPCMRGCYFGKSIDPYEAIFFKNNRY